MMKQQELLLKMGGIGLKRVSRSGSGASAAPAAAASTASGNQAGSVLLGRCTKHDAIDCPGYNRPKSERPEDGGKCTHATVRQLHTRDW